MNNIVRQSGLALTLCAAFCLQAYAKENQDGVKVGGMSSVRGLVSEERVEQQALQQYTQLKQQSEQQHALGPADHPQVLRIRAIAQKLLPYTYKWNERAKAWQWEVNLIGSQQVNAFCMPGGKIAMYTGIIDKLKLTDDEIAIVMGHEITHALREHGRERMAKGQLTQLAVGLGSALLGLGQVGNMVAGQGAQLLLLKFSRSDETEADLIGFELAARAGYDPRAGITLWQKMSAANKGAPPQWLSTHPAGKTRIQDMAKHLPEVMPLFAHATGQNVASLPPYQTNVNLPPVPYPLPKR